MNKLERIKDHFDQSIKAKLAAAETLPDKISLAGEMLCKCLQAGNKILACGNGGSAADAQHFAAELLNRFEIERPSLPALALTTDTSTITSIANDYHYDEVYSKQLRGLGNAGDIVIVISTSGNSNNILNTITAAHEKNISVIALSGKDGGKLKDYLSDTDIELRVPATNTARIQETHILILHILCDFIDNQLFNG